MKFEICGIAALALAGFVCLWRQRRVIRDTTLGAAWCWSMLSLAVVAGCELVIGLSNHAHTATWIPPLRFVAAVLTFCPFVAVLGAKRPQDGMWNCIVASLWGILSLPAAEGLFVQRGQALEVDDLRAWFLWLLIAAGALNYLPTRRWLYAMLYGSAQVLLLAEYLPLLRWTSAGLDRIVGLALLVAAYAVAARKLPLRASVSPLDHVWLDFRDLYGALWGLRIVERINSAATLNRWDLFLNWSGFGRMSRTDQSSATVFDDLPADTTAAVQQSVLSLLRRFVDPAWLRARLGADINVEA